MFRRLLPLFLLVTGIALAQKQNTCGDIPYDPSQAICRDDILCPVVDGFPQDLCGGQCYSSLNHTCDNGTICPRAPQEGPYLIRVLTWYGDMDELAIDACGGAFFAGRSSSSCTWCPYQQFPETCSAAVNITVLEGTENMHVIVPGGQRFYINALGALAYTRAHSGIIPENSIVGEIQAFQEGGFIYAAGGGWYACPASEPGVYQIFNRLEGVVLDAACIGINIAVNSLEGGLFAWQYQ
ncbi:uncharacterized protein LTHEOB_3297 [Lasiodiplodia theobromae]|uniref:uncharacterized protein n=1 Tax=Lasiodiplodia theobromae TaxID=45133 RepID=UPI0015C36E12|nr:uncharacterized protein LTHEOB_3297 [Lasiodiplodia theobromae]KAF4534489.1 hypothetical protein LTHEOB_3297 [Lasiodiplodia theobromae]